MTDTIEIRGGTLIDGTGGPPLADATVQVSGGVIRAVWHGPDRPSRAAGAGEVVDARGKTVLPGLIDAHCHLSYGEGRSAEEIDVYGGA
ncbi:MAG: amidohydrolase family protein, partial [Candidatus Rokuibacteriota bacterium]